MARRKKVRIKPQQKKDFSGLVCTRCGDPLSIGYLRKGKVYHKKCMDLVIDEVYEKKNKKKGKRA